MSKKRMLKTLAMMAVLLCVVAVPAMAQSELDQSQTNLSVGWGMDSGTRVKQTFTAQKTGTLDTVDFYASCWFTCDPYDTYYNPGGMSTLIQLEVKGTGGDTPVGNVRLNQGDSWYSVTMNPAPFVQAGKQYELELSVVEGAGYGTGILGSSSDLYPGGEFYSLAGDNNWYTSNEVKDLAFRTYVTPDTTAPKVDDVDPAAGAKDVARGTDVTANFSEPMDPDTLTASTFKLYKVNADGTTKQLTNAPVTPSEDGLSATLNPFGSSSDTRLAKNTKYKAVVTTGAKDLAGNALDQNATSGNQQKAWYFTTGRK